MFQAKVRPFNVVLCLGDNHNPCFVAESLIEGFRVLFVVVSTVLSCSSLHEPCFSVLLLSSPA